MSIEYKGNFQWQQVAEPEWTSGGFGEDRCRILWRGARPLMANFIKGIQRWASMPGFPGMKLEDWSSQNISPSFPGIEFRYVGFKSNQIPDAKAVDDITSQSAQGSGIDTASGAEVSGSFVYRASRTTWTWFETKEPPQVPRYATVRYPIEPLQNIDSYSLTDNATGRRVNTIPYSSFVAVFNSLVKKVVVSNYERECLVPGSLWACRTDVDYKIVN